MRFTNGTLLEMLTGLQASNFKIMGIKTMVSQMLQTGV
jgi:hypothetical protein